MTALINGNCTYVLLFLGLFHWACALQKTALSRVLLIELFYSGINGPRSARWMFWLGWKIYWFCFRFQFNLWSTSAYQGLLRVQARPATAYDDQGLVFAVAFGGFIRMFDARKYEKVENWCIRICERFKYLMNLLVAILSACIDLFKFEFDRVLLTSSPSVEIYQMQML